MESGQEGSNPSHQGTNRSLSNRRKKTGWRYFNPLETWKASRIGRDRPDTYAASYLAETAESAGAAANKAAANKISKYSTLATTHHFVPIFVETGGPCNPESSEFIAELGKRIFQIYTRTIGNTISFPKAVHIAAEEKRTSSQKHVLSRVIFVPGSVPF